jgi:hypothetical protein
MPRPRWHRCIASKEGQKWKEICEDSAGSVVAYQLLELG